MHNDTDESLPTSHGLPCALPDLAYEWRAALPQSIESLVETGDYLGDAVVHLLARLWVGIRTEGESV